MSRVIVRVLFCRSKMGDFCCYLDCNEHESSIRQECVLKIVRDIGDGYCDFASFVNEDGRKFFRYDSARARGCGLPDEKGDHKVRF